MKKILLVEDDQFIGDITTQKLANAGFPVVVAATGAEALELFKTEKPEVILLDLDLPDISGVEVLKQVKDSAVPVTVFIFSNNDDPVVHARVQELGADKFYIKANTDLSVLITDLQNLT